MSGITGIGCFINLVLGGVSRTNDQNNVLTSVSPAMRNSLLQVVCHADWVPGSLDGVLSCCVMVRWSCCRKWFNVDNRCPACAALNIVDKFDEFADTILGPLSNMNWIYWNEPQHNVEDWPSRYWAPQTYDRLLAVKNAVDPTGFFVCYHCVGSDQIADAGQRSCARRAVVPLRC